MNLLNNYIHYVLKIILTCYHLILFFFSSRRRHTRWPRDWSSDVCSSDLGGLLGAVRVHPVVEHLEHHRLAGDVRPAALRSEERRVGKECRSWWWPYL